MGGETAGNEDMLGVVEDNKRDEFKQGVTRGLAGSLEDALLGTEADILRSMLDLAVSRSTDEVGEEVEYGRGLRDIQKSGMYRLWARVAKTPVTVTPDIIS